jgi:hypothetical protein
VESVGVFHQHRLFLSVCVVDFIHVLEGLSFFSRKAHTLDDEELAKFESAEDEEDEEELIEDEADKFFSDKFDYTRNYAESIAVFTSIAVYSTMHPTMMLLGSVYFAIKYYVDKYQITNQYSKPHVQYGRRARSTTIYILWSQAIGQWLNAIYHLVLTDETAIGGAMLFSAIVMQIVTTVYVYQPEKLKCVPPSPRGPSTFSRGDLPTRPAHFALLRGGLRVQAFENILTGCQQNRASREQRQRCCSLVRSVQPAAPGRPVSESRDQGS